MNLKSFGLYLILSIIWCVVFFKTIGNETRELILLIPVDCLFFTLCWICLLILIRVTGIQSSKLILLFPPLLAIFGFMAMDRSDFTFVGGMLVVGELSLLYSLISSPRLNK